jgi:hypothetical protein
MPLFAGPAQVAPAAQQMPMFGDGGGMFAAGSTDNLSELGSPTGQRKMYKARRPSSRG